jgi:lysophospholipase L1-like esterase
MTRLFLFCSIILLNPFNLSAGEEPNLFHPENGDSVVFLGGTLIERAQQYGFWESMMISETADKNIIFRNLGWSGDTVFAESRGIFDPPAKGYQRMIERIKKIDPRYIFISYGGNESFSGTEGVARFLNQLEVLLKDVKGNKTEVILITPVLFEKKKAPLPDPTEANKNRELYIKALKQFGEVHNIPVLNPFSNAQGIQKLLRLPGLTYNGIHLTSHGYYKSSNSLRSQLFPSFKNTKLVVNIAGVATTTFGLSISDFEKNSNGLSFDLKRKTLPLVDNKNELSGMSRINISIQGLTRGNYTLSVEGEPVMKASETEWSKGQYINSPSDLKQARELNAIVLKKNELYFHSWRPQNITYLLGFRKHEQGQNAKEIDEILKLVKKEEENIYALQKTRAQKYTLIKD